MPGRSGALCEPRDTEAFVKQICAWSEGPEQLTAMSKEARRHALGRSWNSIFDDLLENYELILNVRRIGIEHGVYSA
ncbi:hypothetical protein D3C78_1030950 [compost metagenome]